MILSVNLNIGAKIESKAQNVIKNRGEAIFLAWTVFNVVQSTSPVLRGVLQSPVGSAQYQRRAKLLSKLHSLTRRHIVACLSVYTNYTTV